MSIRLKIRKKLVRYGFYYFSSQKLDGPFQDYRIFPKNWNESWRDALKKSIIELQESDSRLSKPVIIKFFTKL